jgi:hypothetical protein
MAYLLDVVSYHSTDTWVFEFLGPASLLCLFIGLPTLFVGCICLTRQISSQTSFAIGLLFFLAWMLGTLMEWLGIVSINMHDWSVIIGLLTLSLIPFGFVFVVGGSRKR